MAQKYIAPVPQGTSRGFGNGHNGIDYLTPMGTPVKASGDGVVAFEGWGKDHPWITWMGGITVLIRHDDGHTGYAHLQSTTVNIGQTVKQNQVIGHSGNTGNVVPKPTPQNPGAGSHLHFEFLPLVPDFKNGYSGRVDPRGYFSKQITIASPEGGKPMRKMSREELIWNYRLIGGYEPPEEQLKSWLDSGADYVATNEEMKRYFANNGTGYYQFKAGAEKTIADLKKNVEELKAALKAGASDGGASESDKQLKEIKDAAQTLVTALGIK